MSEKSAARPVESQDDREVDVALLVRGTLALVLVCGVVVASLLAIDGAFESAARRRDRPPSPLELAGRSAPPEPRLQSTPTDDLARIRTEEAERLSGWGWVSPARSAARIPIDRAIELVAKRGVAPLVVMPVAGSSAAPGSAAPVSTAPAPASGGGH